MYDRSKHKASYDKKAQALIEKLLGKTIKSLDVHQCSYPSEDQIGSITLLFTDGTKLDINACGDGGCFECDPDGINTHWLDV